MTVISRSPPAKRSEKKPKASSELSISTERALGKSALANRPTLKEERRLWKAGHEWVAGIDEVGRGAWAGPLSVGVAVVRPGATQRSVPRWLRDSKLLPEERREGRI